MDYSAVGQSIPNCGQWQIEHETKHLFVCIPCSNAIGIEYFDIRLCAPRQFWSQVVRRWRFNSPSQYIFFSLFFWESTWICLKDKYPSALYLWNFQQRLQTHDTIMELKFTPENRVWTLQENKKPLKRYTYLLRVCDQILIRFTCQGSTTAPKHFKVCLVNRWKCFECIDFMGKAEKKQNKSKDSKDLKVTLKRNALTPEEIFGVCAALIAILATITAYISVSGNDSSDFLQYLKQQAENKAWGKSKRGVLLDMFGYYIPLLPLCLYTHKYLTKQVNNLR